MTDTPRSPRMTLVIAAVAALTGLVWILQGLGAPIGRSFMVGDPLWAVAGVLVVAAASFLAWRTLRRT